MKTSTLTSTLFLVAGFLFTSALFAQSETTVTVKVKKDGKIVTDTTYQFEDDNKAKHAMKMMEIMSGDDEHMEMLHKHMEGDKHHNRMVFVSKDGEKIEIEELHGDSLVWVSEGDHDADYVKVKKRIVKKSECCEHAHGEHAHGEHAHGEHAHGEHVIIMKKEGEKTFDIVIDEDCEGEHKVKEKRVKVTVAGEEHGEWHVSGDHLEEVEEDVYVIAGDDVKEELNKILEEHEGDEDVKVIVVKKKKNKK